MGFNSGFKGLNSVARMARRDMTYQILAGNFEVGDHFRKLKNTGLVNDNFCGPFCHSVILSGYKVPNATTNDR